MSFYSRMQQTTNKLLKGKGQAVTLTKVVPGTYDPATGGVTNTSTTQTGTGAILDWNSRNVDGTTIKIGDKRLLLSALNSAGAALTAPALGDKITDAASVVYTLVAPLEIISPAGTPVLYKCNMRA